MDAPNAIFESSAAPIWGIFSLQVSIGDGATPEREEAQARALIDAAMAHGTSHFVYLSAARHDAISFCGVPAFDVKLRVERYLAAQCAAEGVKMTWSVLRPAVFCENMSPDFTGKVFAATWRDVIKGKLQIVSTQDVGVFAAMAFANSEKWAGRSLSIAGDELTFTEANKIVREVTGKGIPTTTPFMRWFAFNVVVKELGHMYRYFGSVSLDADIEALRAEYPDMMTWRTWVQQSAFNKK